MDYDALAATGIVISAIGLFATLNAVWGALFLLSVFYGGWRFGQRIIPPETAEV